MKPPSSKLQPRHQEQTTEAQQAQQQTAGQTFATPEEMLRADAAQTEVPAAIKTRLASSIQQEPRPERPASWWRRFFS